MAIQGFGQGLGIDYHPFSGLEHPCKESFRNWRPSLLWEASLESEALQGQVDAHLSPNGHLIFCSASSCYTISWLQWGCSILSSFFWWILESKTPGAWLKVPNSTSWCLSCIHLALWCPLPVAWGKGAKDRWFFSLLAQLLCLQPSGNWSQLVTLDSSLPNFWCLNLLGMNLYTQDVTLHFSARLGHAFSTCLGHNSQLGEKMTKPDGPIAGQHQCFVLALC